MILPRIPRKKHRARYFSIRLESLSRPTRSSGWLALMATTMMLGLTGCNIMSQPSANRKHLEASFCDLVKRPDYYGSQTVRVRSILTGYHELALYSPVCDNQVKYIRADLDSKSHQELVKSAASLAGGGLQRGNFWVDVVVTGRFEKIPGSDCKNSVRETGMPDRYYVNYCYRMEISSVEQVRDVPSTITWP
jgi:hypothetical protein